MRVPQSRRTRGKPARADVGVASDAYRWVILAAGTFAQSTFAVCVIGLPALAPALRSHYGLTLGETGVVLAALGFGMLLTLLPWGLLADRFDERWVIAAGLAAAAVALCASAATKGFASLTLALAVAGAFGASVNAASGRAIMSWFGSRELGFALGIRQTAIPIGGAVGAATLPLLASAGGTRLAFFVLGGSCAVGAVVAGMLVRGGSERPTQLTGVAQPLREPRLWLLGTGTALFITAQIGITGFVVLFLHEHRHVSTHAAAAVLAAINVLAIGARIGSGRISDRMQTRLVPLRTIGIALTGTTALVAALVDEPLAVLAPAFVLAGVLSMAWNGLAFAASAEVAGHARTGAALGFQQTLLGVVGAAVPPAFAAIAASSWRLAFALSALGPLLGVLTLSAISESGRRLGTSATPPAVP